MRAVGTTGVLAMMACAVLATCAHAWRGADDPRNAATWYARAIASWQSFKQSHPSQAKLITNYAGDPAQAITPEIRAALTNVQSVFADMRKGSQQEHCDFSLDYSQGFELLLPHLGEMRGIARAMKADAAVRLADGDTAGAAGSLASMYRTSGHCGDDRVLISSLVGQAIFTTADSSVQSGLDVAAFNAADAATLLGAAQDLGASDPFAYAEAVGIEQEIALATFDKYRGPEGMDALRQLLGDGEGNAQFFDDLDALDEAGFDEALSGYDAAMGKMSEVFMLTDKDAALAEAKKVEAAIAAGEFGPLAKVLSPAQSRLLEQKFKGEQMVAARLATLEALATGAQKPEEAANAAVWYLRAIDMLDHLPVEQLHAVRALDIDLENDLPATVTNALEQWQSIIDVAREGSLKRRCDFRAVSPHRGPPPLAPHYAPGMHDLLRVLAADAMRLLRHEEADAATDRIAMMLRMAAHLSADPNFASNRVAHVQFNRGLDLVDAALARDLLSSPPPPVLADAAGRMSRTDPFGYLGTLTQTREEIVRRFSANPRRSSEDDLRNWELQRTRIVEFTGDQVMYVLVMLDMRSKRMAEAGAPEGDPQWRADDITTNSMLERLTDVLSYEAVEAARGDYADVGPRIAAEDWEIFVGRDVAPIAQVAESIARSRGDLRRATQLLMRLERAAHDPAAESTAPAVSK